MIYIARSDGRWWRNAAIVALAVVALAIALLVIQDVHKAQAGTPTDSATMSLVAKPDEPVDILVKDTFTVSVHMDQISMVDRDGDNVGGYTGWQARVNFSSGLKLVGEPVFTWPDADAATTATSLGTGTVLLGSTVGGSGEGDLNPESTFIGNLVDLTFSCNEPNKNHTITLKGAPETFVLAEPNPGSPPASKTATVSLGTGTIIVDCKAAAMSLNVKGDAPKHFPDPDTGQFHVAVGQKITVNVNVDVIRNLVDKDVDPPDGGGYTAVFAQVVFDDTLLTLQSSNVVVAGCSTPTISTLTNPHTVSCDAFNASQSDESIVEDKVFELVFSCIASGKSEIDLGGPTELVDENENPVNVAIASDPISVRCIGGDEDEDGDKCTTTQEVANGTNPHTYDFWDTNKNRMIDVQDFLNYLLRFGQPADPGPPTFNQVNDTNGDGEINIFDLVAVVAQFGKSCPI